MTTEEQTPGWQVAAAVVTVAVMGLAYAAIFFSELPAATWILVLWH